jgi:hypothetical protein
VDPTIVSRDALYGAACSFTDRAFVHLSSHAEPAPRLKITLRGKPGRAFDAPALTAELEDALAHQAFRCRTFEQGRELSAAIQAGAYGASAASSTHGGLDDLRTFDDPLAIALSWESQKKATPDGEEGA